MVHQQGILIVVGNVKSLGGMLGHDDDETRAFVEATLASYEPLFDALKDPLLPIALALYFSRVCALPKPMHLLHVIPLHITLPIMHSFDERLRGVVLSRIDVSTSLDHTALYTLSQPMSKAGMGLTSLETIAAAARWSAIAIAAPETQFLVDKGTDCALIRDRVFTYRTLVEAGVPVTPLAHEGCAPGDEEWCTLPPNPTFVLSHYRAGDGSSLRHLQHRATNANARSCELKGASGWLTHVGEAMRMSDREFELAMRMRCGLPPCSAPLPSVCRLCDTNMADDAYHFLSCGKLKRRSLNQRHDAIQNGLARFARANSCLVRITPKRAESKVPDLRIVFAEGAEQVTYRALNPWPRPSSPGCGVLLGLLRRNGRAATQRRAPRMARGQA